jgi:hypothetical protein
MPTNEKSRGDGDSSRARKRDRDKENQRLKRKREKDALDELELRNASLERQVKALSSANNGNPQDLLGTIQVLRARNIVLEKRLSEVDNFVNSWISQVSQPVSEVVDISRGIFRHMNRYLQMFN